MSKMIALLLGALLSLLIVSVVVLLILERPVDTLITFASTVIIPTAVSFYAASKAEKAADAAERTVVQTNGRMTELIQLVRDAQGDVPAQYADLEGDPTLDYSPATDEAYGVDESGKPYMKRE